MRYTKFKDVNKTVLFNNKDSYTNYGLILVSYEIGAPQRKTVKVSSLSTQGDIDISDAVARNTYNNRKLTFEFRCLEGDYDDVYSKVTSDLNGVYFDKTLVFNGKKYTGRVSLNKWKSSKFYANFTIEVDAKPYIYDENGAKRYE